MNIQRPTKETDAAFRDGYTFCREDMRPAVEFCANLERERNEAREQLESTREAIKEAWIEIQYAESSFAGLALRVCPNDSAVDSVLNRMTEALAKLQPFLKP